MKRILCYGDSNTNGCNPEWTEAWAGDEAKSVRLPENQRWTGILKKLLGDEYEIIEEGLPGRTTVYADPVYPHFDGKAAVLPVIQTHAPFDLMLIMLGTNDLKVTFSPSLDTCSRAMEELLKVILNPYIWEHKKVPKVLIVSPTAVRENIVNTQFYGMYDEKSVELSKGLASVYEKLSKVYGCWFFDAAKVAEASDLDGIHMDPENHRKLAEALAVYLREKL